MIPGVFPYYVTGALTASGGSWNAAIVAEYVKAGGHPPEIAQGIGSYIAIATEKGNFQQVVLGVAVMSVVRDRVQPPACGGRSSPSPNGGSACPERAWHAASLGPDPRSPRRRPALSDRFGRRRARRARPCDPAAQGRRDRRPPRTVGMREVVAVAHRRRADLSVARTRAVRRSGDRRARRGRGHGVPKLRAVSLADGARQRRARAARQGRVRRERAQARARRHRPDRPRRFRIRLSQGAVRRHASACRLRARRSSSTRRSC